MPHPNAKYPAAREATTARRGVGVGLARVLSKMGIASRTAATVLIEAGRVSVNGQVLLNPEARINMSRDRIALDNTPLTETPKRYIAINKPRGLVTTASDEQGRATVYTCLGEDDQRAWLAPVGRLDKASEGLILFTNDTAWAQRILDPASHLPKTYHVQVSRILSEDEVAQLQHGVVLDDGVFARAAEVRVLRSGEKNCWLEMVLHEGINRQIRRMLAVLDTAAPAHPCDVQGCASVAGERSEGLRMPGAPARRPRASTVQGCTSAARGRMPKAACPAEVLRLIRVAIGPVILGTLSKGQSRPLTEEELTQMRITMFESKQG